MSSKQNIGKIIREKRKSIPLTLSQLSEISGISVSQLNRVENGRRKPSPNTLQKITKPLGFDLNELLVLAGYLSPEPSTLSEEQRNKLQAELHTLMARVIVGSKRITEIAERLLFNIKER